MGTSPGSSSGPESGRRPCPERRGGVGRHGPGRQGAGRYGCPERPSSCSGITLSDEGGQGERARTRRSGASSGQSAWSVVQNPNGAFCRIGKPMRDQDPRGSCGSPAHLTAGGDLARTRRPRDCMLVAAPSPVPLPGWPSPWDFHPGVEDEEAFIRARGHAARI